MSKDVWDSASEWDIAHRRDEFVKAAISGLCVGYFTPEHDFGGEQIARVAIRIADAAIVRMKEQHDAA